MNQRTTQTNLPFEERLLDDLDASDSKLDLRLYEQASITESLSDLIIDSNSFPLVAAYEDQSCEVLEP